MMCLRAWSIGCENVGSSNAIDTRTDASPNTSPEAYETKLNS